MAKHGGRIIGKVAGEEPHKISDKAARLWERYHGPMQGASQQLNAAIRNVEDILGGIIMDMENFDRETHVFDPVRMVIIRRPPAAVAPAGVSNGKVDE